MWALVVLLAATDPKLADAAAKRIDAGAKQAVVYTVSAGQEYSLEGSVGEALADRAGHVAKVAMTFLGETYRSELVVYIADGKPFFARRTTGRYRGGLSDPTIASTTTERTYFSGDAASAELDAMAVGVTAPIITCIASAGSAPPACDAVDAVFDPQPDDRDPRIRTIKREFAATEAARASYVKTDITTPAWNLTGQVYKTKSGELRLVTLDVTGEGAMHLDLYFAGSDLLFSLQRGATTSRVYYADAKPIRIVAAKDKRVRINQDSYTTYVAPVIDYARVAREQAP